MAKVIYEVTIAIRVVMEPDENRDLFFTDTVPIQFQFVDDQRDDEQHVEMIGVPDPHRTSLVEHALLPILHIAQHVYPKRFLAEDVE